MAYNEYVIKVVILVNLQNNNTFVLKKINGCIPTGDSGYANRSYLPTGKNGTRCSQILLRLQRHYVAENAFGELKNHLRCSTKHDKMIVIDI